MLRFTRDHEWVLIDSDIATIGITAHAQQQLGDLVYVELPAIGQSVEQGSTAAVVESVKAASDVYAPLSGQITAINQAIVDEPALVNKDPMGTGWFYKLKISDASQFDTLLTEESYRSLIA